MNIKMKLIIFLISLLSSNLWAEEMLPIAYGTSHFNKYYAEVVKKLNFDPRKAKQYESEKKKFLEETKYTHPKTISEVALKAEFLQKYLDKHPESVPALISYIKILNDPSLNPSKMFENPFFDKHDFLDTNSLRALLLNSSAKEVVEEVAIYTKCYFEECITLLKHMDHFPELKELKDLMQIDYNLNFGPDKLNALNKLERIFNNKKSHYPFIVLWVSMTNIWDPNIWDSKDDLEALKRMNKLLELNFKIHSQFLNDFPDSSYIARIFHQALEVYFNLNDNLYKKYLSMLKSKYANKKELLLSLEITDSVLKKDTKKMLSLAENIKLGDCLLSTCYEYLGDSLAKTSALPKDLKTKLGSYFLAASANSRHFYSDIEDYMTRTFSGEGNSIGLNLEIEPYQKYYASAMPLAKEIVYNCVYPYVQAMNRNVHLKIDDQACFEMYKKVRKYSDQMADNIMEMYNYIVFETQTTSRALNNLKEYLEFKEMPLRPAWFDIWATTSLKFKTDESYDEDVKRWMKQYPEEIVFKCKNYANQRSRGNFEPLKTKEAFELAKKVQHLTHEAWKKGERYSYENPGGLPINRQCISPSLSIYKFNNLEFTSGVEQNTSNWVQFSHVLEDKIYHGKIKEFHEYYKKYRNKMDYSDVYFSVDYDIFDTLLSFRYQLTKEEQKFYEKGVEYVATNVDTLDPIVNMRYAIQLAERKNRDCKKVEFYANRASRRLPKSNSPNFGQLENDIRKNLLKLSLNCGFPLALEGSEEPDL
ncbi:MAG: hypothetical protein H6622_01130 [Halobacteriovoraceae bacterium]|nr:hypothetical protein [Halobacteriovoraceae bacterium]